MHPKIKYDQIIASVNRALIDCNRGDAKGAAEELKELLSDLREAAMIAETYKGA